MTTKVCIVTTSSNHQRDDTRLTASSDKVYQLLAHDRWFSPGAPASSTIITGRHDIAEILLKVALINQKSKSIYYSNKKIYYHAFLCRYV
jgi:hypothetical protein